MVSKVRRFRLCGAADRAGWRRACVCLRNDPDDIARHGNYAGSTGRIGQERTYVLSGYVEFSLESECLHPN